MQKYFHWRVSSYRLGDQDSCIFISNDIPDKTYQKEKHLNGKNYILESSFQALENREKTFPRRPVTLIWSCLWV